MSDFVAERPPDKFQWHADMQRLDIVAIHDTHIIVQKIIHQFTA